VELGSRPSCRPVAATQLRLSCAASRKQFIMGSGAFGQSLYLRAYYTSAGTRWNVIRYPLASHFIFYWSMQKRYFDWNKSQFQGMVIRGQGSGVRGQGSGVRGQGSGVRGQGSGDPGNSIYNRTPETIHITGPGHLRRPHSEDAAP